MMTTATRTMAVTLAALAAAAGTAAAAGLTAARDVAYAATAEYTYDTYGSAGLTAAADGAPVTVRGVTVDGVRTERSGEWMRVGLTLGLDGLEVGGNRAVLVTPRLVNGADSLDLESLVVYGRRRWYWYERNGLSLLPEGAEGLSYKAKDAPGSVEMGGVVPYEGWMDGAQVRLSVREYGCCGSATGNDGEEAVGGYAEPREPEPIVPEAVYVTPAAEARKSRSLDGSALVAFAVNRTEIDPSYGDNPAELGRIRATIDSVRRDSDMSITSVRLKGYASPEGRYALNEKLAEGRVEALRGYIDGLYDFAPGTVSTDWEAEDWDGLRRWVEGSSLAHRDGILSVIDGEGDAASLDEDGREWRIRSLYPDDYAVLLRECYPSLRRTDYRVSYDIRGYADVEEIRRVFAESPGKLSLNELYLLAGEYEPGSAEFAEVFATAARLYPSDAAANVNAANAAMQAGDYGGASRFLSRAGDSAEAVYARAALAVRTGDLDGAATLLRKASDMGLEQADTLLEKVEEKTSAAGVTEMPPTRRRHREGQRKSENDAQRHKGQTTTIKAYKIRHEKLLQINDNRLGRTARGSGLPKGKRLI